MYTFEIEKSGALSEESRREKCFRWGKDREKGRFPLFSREKEGSGRLFRKRAAGERMRRFPYGRIRLFTGAAFLFSCRFRLENFPDVVE